MPPNGEGGGAVAQPGQHPGLGGPGRPSVPSPDTGGWAGRRGGCAAGRQAGRRVGRPREAGRKVCPAAEAGTPTPGCPRAPAPPARLGTLLAMGKSLPGGEARGGPRPNQRAPSGPAARPDQGRPTRRRAGAAGLGWALGRDFAVFPSLLLSALKKVTRGCSLPAIGRFVGARPSRDRFKP